MSSPPDTSAAASCTARTATTGTIGWVADELRLAFPMLDADAARLCAYASRRPGSGRSNRRDVAFAARLAQLVAFGLIDAERLAGLARLARPVDAVLVRTLLALRADDTWWATTLPRYLARCTTGRNASWDYVAEYLPKSPEQVQPTAPWAPCTTTEIDAFTAAGWTIAEACSDIHNIRVHAAAARVGWSYKDFRRWEPVMAATPTTPGAVMQWRQAGCTPREAIAWHRFVSSPRLVPYLTAAGITRPDLARLERLGVVVRYLHGDDLEHLPVIVTATRTPTGRALVRATTATITGGTARAAYIAAIWHITTDTGELRRWRHVFGTDADVRDITLALRLATPEDIRGYEPFALAAVVAAHVIGLDPTRTGCLARTLSSPLENAWLLANDAWHGALARTHPQLPVAVDALIDPNRERTPDYLLAAVDAAAIALGVTADVPPALTTLVALLGP